MRGAIANFPVRSCALKFQYGFGGQAAPCGPDDLANGGGGAGYYGGGTTNDYASGGGGSGYLSATYLASGPSATTAGALNGIPCSAALTDGDYPGASISYGGRQTQTGGAGQTGFNAYVVILY